MTKAFEAFEQQIQQIYELLLGSGADVTWDDRIPDPDNPTQARQIDVTIRRNGKLTLVECRQHQRPQDVQWIEELFGRRTSLAADAIIGVSSSGFTAGALEKARRLGVFLRDLQRLTDAEVEGWGQHLALTLYFYEYSDLEVSLLFDQTSIAKLDVTAVKLGLKSHPAMRSLFNASAAYLGGLNLLADENSGRIEEFALRLQPEEFNVCGEPVIEVSICGNVCLISREILSPAVFGYGEPRGDSRQPEAIVEIFSLGKTSITHDASRVSLFLDISQLEMPPFCQFRFFRVSSDHEVDHEAVEFVGVEKLWVYGQGLKVNLCSMLPSADRAIEPPR
jgi:hypothetical protein